MTLRFSRCILVSAALAASAGAWAKDNVAHADAAFMKSAAEAGIAEMEASRLALSKAANTQVKGFAQQMVDDHSKAAEALKALAASKRVSLPTKPSMMQKARLKALKGIEGAKFDARYAEEYGVKAHEDTLQLFQNAVSKSKDGDVKAFAQKTLPTLQHHLEMAKDLSKSTTAEKKSAKSAPAPAASR
jgi:putative membrane protein